MVLHYAKDERRPPNKFDGLSDAELAAKLDREIRYHDGLIDSADMGDERIYFSGKAIDAMRAEQRRRATGSAS